MIIHLDADAFFASVEQADNPDLRGKAMAVGGESRGIIASASYEARRCGVYTPMPTSKAKQVCPHLIVVPGDFTKYGRYSEAMFAFAEDYTPWIERCSIDEGYFDLTGNGRVSALEAARGLQARIVRELGITVSLGIAANKLVAQIASKLRKPNAIVEVPVGTEREFLAPLECHWLPGVGAKLGAVLREVGLRTVADIASAPIEFLNQVAGNYGPQLQEYALGVDPRPVVCEREDAKSYSMQETFEDNVTDAYFVVGQLRAMADDLMSKVRGDRKAVRTVTVRVRYRDMSNATHGLTLDVPTDLETDIYPYLPQLVREVWQRKSSVRLVGLRLSNVGDPGQQGELLLEANDQRRSKQQQAARLLDELRARALPISRGHTVKKKAES